RTLKLTGRGGCKELEPRNHIMPPRSGAASWFGGGRSRSQALHQAIGLCLISEVAAEAGEIVAGCLVILPRLSALRQECPCGLFRQPEEFLEPLKIQLKAQPVALVTLTRQQADDVLPTRVEDAGKADGTAGRVLLKVLLQARNQAPVEATDAVLLGELL